MTSDPAFSWLVLFKSWWSFYLTSSLFGNRTSYYNDSWMIKSIVCQLMWSVTAHAKRRDLISGLQTGVWLGLLLFFFPPCSSAFRQQRACGVCIRRRTQSAWKAQQGWRKCYGFHLPVCLSLLEERKHVLTRCSIDLSPVTSLSCLRSWWISWKNRVWGPENTMLYMHTHWGLRIIWSNWSTCVFMRSEEAREPRRNPHAYKKISYRWWIQPELGETSRAVFIYG